MIQQFIDPPRPLAYFLKTDKQSYKNIIYLYFRGINSFEGNLSLYQFHSIPLSAIKIKQIRSESKRPEMQTLSAKNVLSQQGPHSTILPSFFWADSKAWLIDHCTLLPSPDGTVSTFQSKKVLPINQSWHSRLLFVFLAFFLAPRLAKLKTY